MKSQNERILAAFKRGVVLTPMKALRQFNCGRLAARVLDLKQSGHPIQRRMMTSRGKRFAAYWM